MKKYENSLFVGNVLKRWVEEYRDITKLECIIVGEEVLLYKTQNGNYVPAEDLNLDKLFAGRRVKAIEKVEPVKESKVSPDLIIMPAISLVDASKPKNNDPDGTLGLFVDKDTLVPYADYVKSNQNQTGVSSFKK